MNIGENSEYTFIVFKIPKLHFKTNHDFPFLCGH